MDSLQMRMRGAGLTVITDQFLPLRGDPPTGSIGSSVASTRREQWRERQQAKRDRKKRGVGLAQAEVDADTLAQLVNVGLLDVEDFKNKRLLATALGDCLDLLAFRVTR